MPVTHVQHAVYEFLVNPHLTLSDATLAHDVHVRTLSRIVKRWRELNHEVTPASPSDVAIKPRRHERPRILSDEDVKLLAKAIIKFSDE